MAALKSGVSVSEEEHDRFAAMREREIEQSLATVAIERQEIFNERFYTNRKILLKWILEVGPSWFHLRSQTTQAAAALTDRCLFHLPAPTPNILQLMGCACIMITAKLEEDEMCQPRPCDLISAAADSFKKEALFAMERRVLNLLHWEVSVITPAHFLGYISRCSVCDTDILDGRFVGSGLDKAQIEEGVRQYAQALIEMFMPELPLSRVNRTIEIAIFNFLDLLLCDERETSIGKARFPHFWEPYSVFFRPSEMAAAAVLVARRHLQFADPWPAFLVQHTHYSAESLQTCAELMIRTEQMNEELFCDDDVSGDVSPMEEDAVESSPLQK